MTVRLADLRACFEGVIPSIVATVDGEGMPNVSYLSQVHFVDDAHVALTNQFFSKTAANIALRCAATLMVVDGRSGDQFLIDIAPVRRENAGPLFERMSIQLAATSGHGGWGEVMKLRSADIYRVEAIRAVPSPGVAAAPTDPAGRVKLEAVALLAAAIGAEPDAGAMLDRALEGLATDLGIRHSMVLVPAGEGRRLVTLASRGYPARGVGSEVALGEGVIGLVGEWRVPVRISDMSRGRRYAAAAGAGPAGSEREIALPGLAAPQSQIAVPLVAQGRLTGVLFAESPERFAFCHEHEAALSLIALPLAAGLRMNALGAGEATGAATPEAAMAEAPQPVAATLTGGVPFLVRHHRFDDAVFIGGDYLIRGVAGRLVMLMLRDYLATGRTEFANQQIRRAPELRLPDLKDNLETRLLLLRRRLEEKDAPLRIHPAGRGRVRLELGGTPLVESVP
ncbi:GAF domain-containing protein [Ancylobacter sp. MQZ15Z-1]|uniref:GAF domain-containing protein n=1 Tax=Ancylobacter mangrovi TaxID=2972472 RepID=A0A9X2T5I7_9HYPH|nr:GAF domain-containing protein [Ancylobacter mangrovi]MCS0497331.1 GAF domain-containing protein [Ancylobacter mangrovi]